MNLRWDTAQQQLAVLATAAVAGMLLGTAAPGFGDAISPAIWPVLAGVLYATFLQVHVRSLPEALGSRGFLGASLIGNFAVVPVLVAAATFIVPLEEAVKVGVLLVLLAPCTDWFVSFTHLGRGDTRLAAAITPLLLLVQFALVPLYLWLLTDIDLEWAQAWPLVYAFLFIVLLPLVLAGVTQHLWKDSASPFRVAERAVVPLLALTLFLVAASEAPAAWDARSDVGAALAIFVVYVGVAAVLARLLAGAVRLSSPAGRTLAFNFGSRNSFVVLPIALTLPSEYALAAAVIAAQSIVELFGMLVYVRWVPAKLFPGAS